MSLKWCHGKCLLCSLPRMGSNLKCYMVRGKAELQSLIASILRYSLIIGSVHRIGTPCFKFRHMTLFDGMRNMGSKLLQPSGWTGIFVLSARTVPVLTKSIIPSPGDIFSSANGNVHSHLSLDSADISPVAQPLLSGMTRSHGIISSWAPSSVARGQYIQ